MGSFSIWHWLVVLLVVLLLFGSGKVSTLMGDFAKGIKAFKKNMADDSTRTRRWKPAPSRLRRARSRVLPSLRRRLSRARPFTRADRGATRPSSEQDVGPKAEDSFVADPASRIVRVGNAAAGHEDVLEVGLYRPPGRGLELIRHLDKAFAAALRLIRAGEGRRVPVQRAHLLADEGEAVADAEGVVVPAGERLLQRDACIDPESDEVAIVRRSHEAGEDAESAGAVGAGRQII